MAEGLFNYITHIDDTAPPASAVASFCEKNRAFWEKWSRQFDPPSPDSVVVTPLTSHAVMVLSPTIPAAVAAAVSGSYRLSCFKTRGQANTPINDILSSFGPNHVTSLPDLGKGARKKLDQEAVDVFESLRNVDDILTLRHEDIPIGDLVYDGAMRVKPWQATVRKLDERVLSGIKMALLTIEAVNRIVARYEVKAAVVSRSHTPFLGTMLRAFAARGVTSYLGTHRLIKRSAQNQAPLFEPVRPSEALVNEILSNRKAEAQSAAQHFFERNFVPENTARSAESARKGFCEAHGLDDKKACAFVLLHNFNDYPHVVGKSAFQDYFDWFRHTLEFVREVRNVNWIFKEHPNSGFYPTDADPAQMVRGTQEKHLCYLDRTQSVDRRLLWDVAHAVVTCGGTGSLEHACHGVATVAAGGSYYTGYGICHEPSSLEEYARILREIEHIKPPTEEQMSMGKLILYLAYGDLGEGCYSLLPPLLTRTITIDQIVDWMATRYSAPEFQRNLQGLQTFVEDESAIQFLNPHVYPEFEGLKVMGQPCAGRPQK